MCCMYVANGYTIEFAGLHIDPKVIGAKNSKIQGPHIRRKNNCIVNTGGKLSREELKKRVASNKEEFVTKYR